MRPQLEKFEQYWILADIKKLLGGFKDVIVIPKSCFFNSLLFVNTNFSIY